MEHLSFNPRNLIVFALSITVIAFSICYDMSIRENWMKPPELFLSGAINYMPASSIGAFGLILGIACIPPVMLVRYVQVEESAPGLRVNKISLYSSWIASFGGKEELQQAKRRAEKTASSNSLNLASHFSLLVSNMARFARRSFHRRLLPSSIKHSCASFRCWCFLHFLALCCTLSNLH